MPELPLMLRAALPSVPVVNQLPGIRKTKGELDRPDPHRARR